MSVVSGHQDPSTAYRLIRPQAELYHCMIHLAEWSGVEGFVKQLTVWHVRPELCVDARVVDVLLEGLTAAAALSASAGAQILDVWRANDRIALAAEHISGMTMGQALARARSNGERLPLDTVLAALLEVVHALEQAHDPDTRAGAVCHGDLRPDCVCFGYEGAVKLTGFGFGSFLPLVNAEGGWFTWGGRCYQAPERFYGAPATPQTDVFSVGAMLLEAAADVAPYGTSDARQILIRMQARQGGLPRGAAGLDEDLAGVVGKACAAAPEDRYQSMTELAADLYRIQIERRRASSEPPLRLRELLRTLESPSQRWAKGEPTASGPAASHKSQVLKAPRLTQVSRPPPITMPSKPLVGRTEVLRAVSQSLAATGAGRGQAILVTGVDGMGKTRLLTEIAVRLSSSRRKLAWVQVQCQPQDATTPYGAVLRLLSSAIGLPPESGLEQLADQADRLRAFGLEATTIAAVRGVLGQGTPPEPAHLAGLMTQGLVQCLSSLSWEQTTIAAWDDCQWTDEASMDCLGELLNQLALIPVVVLLTAPRDFTLPWLPRSLRAIELGPLSTQESEGLVLHHVEGAEAVDAALMAAILERTGGNPALIEQHVALLGEAGLLEVVGHVVRLRDEAGSGEVPSLIEGVRARFARLPEESATVAVVAALASPVLHERVIARAMGLPEPRVREALVDLEQRGVLTLRRQGYTFPHERLLEATLSAADPGALDDFRPRVARAILAEVDDGTLGWTDFAAVLLADAGDRPGAAQVHVEAAKRREARGDLAGAAERYERALGLARGTGAFPPQEELRLLLKIGHAALHSLRLELGEQALLQARQLAEMLGATGAGARARVMLCRLMARQGRLKEAMEVVQEATPLAEQSGEPLILAQVYLAIAESYQQWGEYGPDFEYIEPALRLASESGDLLQLGRGLQLAVIHAAGVGKYQRTEELLKRARAIARTSGDPLLTCQLKRAETLLDIFSGNPEQGLIKTLEGLELAHRHGLQELEVIFLHNAGDAHLRCGRLQEAFYYFNESQRRALAARFDRLTEGNAIYLGYLEATYLQNPGGFERLTRATDTAREKGRMWNVTQGHQLMGRTLLAQGNVEGALTHLQEALRVAQASGVAFFIEEATHWITEAERQQITQR